MYLFISAAVTFLPTAGNIHNTADSNQNDDVNNSSSLIEDLLVGVENSYITTM